MAKGLTLSTQTLLSKATPGDWTPYDPEVAALERIWKRMQALEDQ